MPGEFTVFLGDEERARIVRFASKSLVQFVLIGEIETATYVVVILSSFEASVVCEFIDIGPQQVGLVVCMFGTFRPPYSMEVVLEVSFHIVLVV